MPAPDLPMRERIAEALHPIPEWPDIFFSETPEAARERHHAEGLRLADAVLTILADLPDTAVEARAREAYEADRHLSPTLPEFVSPWDEAEPFVRAAYRSTCRTNLTAAIAAFKEGKA